MKGIISYGSLLWLLPIIFMIHDFEEIVYIPGWMRKNSEYILEKVPGFLKGFVRAHTKISTAQFSASVALIFVSVSIVTFLAAERGFYQPYIALDLGLFLHSFFHIASAVFLKRWTPGSVTSLLLILYGILSIGCLSEKGLLNIFSLTIYGVVGLLVMVPFIILMLSLGKKLVKEEDT